MEHTLINLAALFDQLEREETAIAHRNEDMGRVGVAYEHRCKANAYAKASLLTRFGPEFDKEVERLGKGEKGK